MHSYFPGNYAWNLAVSMALDMGANIDEIDRASAELKAVALGGKEAAIAFFDSWSRVAIDIDASARVDEAAGQALTAAAKYRRACAMFISAERMPPHTLPRRKEAYERVVGTLADHVRCAQARCEQVLVPYEGKHLPALFVPAPGLSAGARAPCVVQFNGLDGVKEMIYLTGFPEQLNARGISILIVDNPGVGGALRYHGLHNSHAAELPASACLDYLLTRDEVDGNRIGICGISLGGYHAPRALAFEPRFACGLIWGANYDWGKLLRRRLSGASAAAGVLGLIEHIQWVLGKKTPEDCMEEADKFSLAAVLDRIKVPVFISHGANDAQIAVDAAVDTYTGLVNSPLRTLRIHTEREGGQHHCSIGHVAVATHSMADWASEVLKTRH